jgi:hypothetical protein
MSTEINADTVTTYEVTADGTQFRLSFRQASGEVAAITLPTECLNQLVMTMPCIAAEALRKRYRDGSLRLVYPLGDWSLATSDGDTHLILTLGTPDGFQIAFALAAGDIARITATMHDYIERLDPAEPARLN